jgi:hypothetical protein
MFTMLILKYLCLYPILINPLKFQRLYWLKDKLNNNNYKVDSMNTTLKLLKTIKL